MWVSYSLQGVGLEQTVAYLLKKMLIKFFFNYKWIVIVYKQLSL